MTCGGHPAYFTIFVSDVSPLYWFPVPSRHKTNLAEGFRAPSSFRFRLISLFVRAAITTSRSFACEAVRELGGATEFELELWS